jgi:adenylylsulfate kinase
MSSEQAFAVWFTGLPASGKSTLANLLAQEIEALDLKVQVLDSDKLRQVLTPQPTYSAQERKWFYHALAYIGKLLAKNGVNVIFAATAHRSIYRERARAYFERFVEVYVKCPLEVCITRDQKGIYKQALSGEAQNVPGVQELYEVPEMPAIVVNSEENDSQICVNNIINNLGKFGYLSTFR